MPLQTDNRIAALPGMKTYESWMLLGINWVLLFCCLLTIYFGNQESWALWIFSGMILPPLLGLSGVIRRYLFELLLQFGMAITIMAAFFTGWAPPMVVLLFVATGLLSLVFLFRPYGGWYFVLMSMLVTVPIAASMMGYSDAHAHHTYSKMAIIIATFLMNGANAFHIAKHNRAARNESIRALQLVQRMNNLHRKFADTIAHTASLHDALWAVTELCIPALNLEDCVIYLVDQKREYLEQVATYGPKRESGREVVSPLKISMGKGIVGTVAQNGSPMMVNDTSRESAYIADDIVRSSELAVPIFFEGKVYAVIDSEHSQKNFFTDDHRALFQVIATLCSNKIGELSLLHSEVKKARAEKELLQINELENLRNTFLNNLSHDLRTPLSLIKGPLQELEKIPQPDVKKLSGVAMRNAERLSEMVSGLLDMHRLERCAMEPNLAAVDFNGKLNEWFSLFLHRAEQTGINYQFESTALPIVSCDAQKIGQVVQNLLSNAFKFTPSKGDICLSVKWSDDRLYISVSDSGPGIPEKERAKIFDRFYKINHDSHIEGTGLGLAMVKEFTALLDGMVSVETSSFGGALFTVSIPASAAENFQSYTAVKTLPRQEQKPLIVLIEDHPEMNAFVAGLLESEYHVYPALNAEDGWELITGYLPDLVITDLMLPGMSGEMLCKRVKTNMATDHIPVLALSAKGSTDTRIELYAYGADNYLTKPFDADELLSLVAALIGQRKVIKAKYGLGNTHASIPRPEGMRLIDAEIASNLVNTGFGPRDLEKAVGMSRNILQRKIKSVTGYTPVQYIRLSRLAHARTDLMKGNINVSEAAYRAGFNQLAYFSKSYKAYFGVSPSEDMATARSQ